MENNPQQILIMGLGCILLSDEGFGVRVINELNKRYVFPEHVSVVDGGVLGIHLMGVMSGADRIIVVDAVKNNLKAGTLSRMKKEDFPERIRVKDSLHQVDFLEALTLMKALDKSPDVTIIGIEPNDIATLATELTPPVLEKVENALDMVLRELDSLGVSYEKQEVA